MNRVCGTKNKARGTAEVAPWALLCPEFSGWERQWSFSLIRDVLPVDGFRDRHGVNAAPDFIGLMGDIGLKLLVHQKGLYRFLRGQSLKQHSTQFAAFFHFCQFSLAQSTLKLESIENVLVEVGQGFLSPLYLSTDQADFLLQLDHLVLQKGSPLAGGVGLI